MILISWSIINPARQGQNVQSAADFRCMLQAQSNGLTAIVYGITNARCAAGAEKAQSYNSMPLNKGKKNHCEKHGNLI